MQNVEQILQEQLPNTAGMKGEMLIQKCQRYWYDRCVEVSGAKFVEFGDEKEASESDFENAITDQTCGVLWVANEMSPGTVVGNNIMTNPLSLEKVIESTNLGLVIYDQSYTPRLIINN